MPTPLDPHLRLHPGGSWSRHAGDDPHALVTIVAYDPAEDPDELGRRESDMNVGTVKSAELAASFCAWYNAAQDRYQESLTVSLPTADDGATPRQPEEESPVAPSAHRLSRQVQVDRELCGALLEVSPCQAARDAYNAHVNGDAALRAGAHPLAPEYACPSCDLARALGVPDRFAVEGPPSEPGVGDQVVYIGPRSGDSPTSEWAVRRASPGTVVRVDSTGYVRVWHSGAGDTHPGVYTIGPRDLRVVERASYTRVYEH
jgi:hypothetical protein